MKSEKPTECKACGKEIPKDVEFYRISGGDYCSAYCACEGEKVGER